HQAARPRVPLPGRHHPHPEPAPGGGAAQRWHRPRPGPRRLRAHQAGPRPVDRPVTGYAVITGSPDETRGVARSVAPLLRAGDVLVVSGDLGSGKTTFVQGLAAGLGVTDPVVSPTFTLA